MSRQDISELMIPPHFTNIQHGLALARKFLGPGHANRQVILITTACRPHTFENEWLYLLYPPQRKTEKATLSEGLRCARDGITINIFLLSNWNQSEEDVRFAYRLAESTRGRVFFTAGKELDRYVVWDYIKRRKHIIS